MAKGRTVTFYVHGAPIPQGSVTGHVAKREDGSRFATIHYRAGSKLHRWRNLVAVSARAAWGEQMSYDPVRLRLMFYMGRPLRHYRLDRSIREAYVNTPHDYVPDLDKLIRAILDSLTGVIYEDDSQVTDINASKLYVPHFSYPVGVEIIASAMPQ